MVVIDEHDIGKTKDEILMDLVYEATGKRMPLDKIVFGEPLEVDPRKDLDLDPNTFISINVDPQFDVRFCQPDSGLLYRRRGIAQHLIKIDPSQIIVDKLPIRVSDLIEQINDQLKFPIFMEDFLDYQYDSVEQLIKYGLVLQPKPGTILWHGSESIHGVNVGNVSGEKCPLVGNAYLMGFFKYEDCGCTLLPH